MLHIVMYHYVRNNEDFEYDCFARRFAEFESQVYYFNCTSEIVNPGDVERVKYYLSSDIHSAYLLTFDDGYKEHSICARMLHKIGLSAFFFPPINILSGELMDVNGIHFLTGQRHISHKKILDYVIQEIKKRNYQIYISGNPVNIDEYIGQTIESRWDTQEILLLKRLLQRDILGDDNRRSLIYDAIKSLTHHSPKDIAKNLYLTSEEMLEMRQLGMYFGSHGLTHRWLETLSMDEQFTEIESSFSKLEELSLFKENVLPKVVCYPYGSYNVHTMLVNKRLNIDFSLTTKPGYAVSHDYCSLQQLNRWDTNDCWDNTWRKPTSPSIL